MILKDGPIVRWLVGENWQVGCIVNDVYDDRLVTKANRLLRNPDSLQEVLVKHWPTGQLEFVRRGLLLPREFRKD